MGQPTARQLELAQQSYDRCQQAPEFFRAFYEAFLESDPRIPPYFAETRFDRQHRLLQHGLGLLLSYAKRANPHLLDRIAARHGSGDLDIPPGLYPFFVDSLVETARTHDPRFNGETESAWRAALEPGLRYMTEFKG